MRNLQRIKVDMNKTNLYLVAALIWGIPGIIISVKGLRAYLTMAPGNLWWLLLITVAVIAGFYFMFSRIVDRYSARIASLPQKTNIWHVSELY